MADDSKEQSERLSEQDRAKSERLQAEIKRKLSVLLSDPRTPETFKNAFLGQRSVG
jgi:hypothetical protein